MEEITTGNPIVSQNPVINYDSANVGTISIETSRAVAEAQGKLIIAQRFPRNEIKAYADVIQACQRKGLAEKAFYNYNRAGSSVSGPTIRFAEEIARCWGNIDYGIKELSQDSGKSEMLAYAWDLQTNAMSQQTFTNPHTRDEKGGTVKKLTSQRDIYEINANMAARRLRARILAIVPADLVEAAIAECKKTLAGKSDEPLIDRVKKLVVAFQKFGVSQEQIEKRLKRKIDSMTTDDFIEYIGIHNAIKDGSSKVNEWFETPKESSDLTNALRDEKKGQ